MNFIFNINFILKLFQISELNFAVKVINTVAYINMSSF